MQKIFNKKEKLLFVTAISVIVFSLMFNMFLFPILSKDYLLNKEIKITQAKFKRYMHLLDNKDYLQGKYNDFSASSSAERNAALAGLTELENIAKSSGVRITDIRPQVQKASSLYQENIIDFRAEGTMEEYTKFIYTIENSPSLLRIKKFQLTARSSTSTLEGSFSVSQVSLP